MIDRLEILYSKLRRMVSRNRWSARLLGYPPVPHGRDEGVGLVLVQIDGLSRKVLERALHEGRMPFLRHLLRDEGSRLRDLYSGLPSSTPGSQAELFYRARAVVPAFAYWDREVGKTVRMNDPATAARVEARLAQEHRGLFRGGSSWSNIYAGEAREPHLSASTTGVTMLLGALDPTRFIGLILWHGWSVVRVVANIFAETALAFWDLFRGTIAGRDFLAELRFVPARVVVTALMREIITAGAAIDCERGLPIVQLNYLGYDEHAHRRGPHSRFALWTLAGIDRSIRRVWLAAHRSPRRDYQVWIYSDHGQEATLPYPILHGEDVRTAVARTYASWLDRQKLERSYDAAERPVAATQRGHDDRRRAAAPPGTLGRDRRSPLRGRRRTDGSPIGGMGTEARRQWLESDLPEWLARSLPREPGGAEQRRTARRTDDAVPPAPRARPAELEVVHQGPVGFVYLERERTREELLSLARAIAQRARIPAVVLRDGERGAVAARPDGRDLALPRETSELVGSDHPFLAEVTEDLLDIVHHPDAGDLVLLGFHPDEPLSLQLEHGAHGGPGPLETGAFVVLPPEAADLAPARLRMSTLHDLAQRVLAGRAGLGSSLEAAPPSEPRPLRVVTYNVHSCRGMDGVYSPARIARAILREQPDIICLQELEHGASRSGWALQVAEIAEALAADYHFHGISRVDDGDFGNAVLSPYPMRLVRSASLPNWAGKQRGVLWVAVEIGGREVQVVNTHLSIVERERRIQADALVGPEWFGSGEMRAPLIFCGDLNASRRSYTCRRLGERLKNVDGSMLAGDSINTWSSRVPLRRIDHVFVSEEITVKGSYVPRTRLTRVASDHLPLVVDLEFARIAPAMAPVTRELEASAPSSLPRR